MSRDEIIKLAREAGFQTGCLYPQNGKGEPTQLVYALGTSCAVEVEKLVLSAYAAGAAAEREAWGLSMILPPPSEQGERNDPRRD